MRSTGRSGTQKIHYSCQEWQLFPTLHHALFDLQISKPIYVLVVNPKTYLITAGRGIRRVKIELEARVRIIIPRHRSAVALSRPYCRNTFTRIISFAVSTCVHSQIAASRTHEVDRSHSLALAVLFHVYALNSYFAIPQSPGFLYQS